MSIFSLSLRLSDFNAAISKDDLCTVVRGDNGQRRFLDDISAAPSGLEYKGTRTESREIMGVGETRAVANDSRARCFSER